MLARIRREARDLLELVLLPGLAAVLPWRICFSILRRLSRWDLLYREVSHRAYDEAVQRGGVRGSRADWLAARRLVTLVDHADFYLARTRSNRWMRRHMTVRGAWPSPQQGGVLFTFHWGAGMWGLRHLAEAGFRVNALVAPLKGAHFADCWVLRKYATARTAEVARILGRATLDVSSSLKPALHALRADQQVLAVVDVPADQVGASIMIPLLGGQAAVPRGMLRLAVERRIPVTVHVLGVDLRDGSRHMHVQHFGVHEDVEVLAKAVFSVLEDAIAAAPAAWHFWSEAPRFFIVPVQSATE